jgi:aminoglycoside 6'-N-acetyltransferase I
VIAALSVQVRPGVSSDLEPLKRQFDALWPREPAAEHAAHVAALLSGSPPSTLPLVVFVAVVEGAVSGFIEVGMRSHADGCDGRQRVGFVEGWYVEPPLQRRAVGRALMAAAEDWARSQGARELASDTWLDNEASVRAHEALGFEVVDRCVNLRKALR